MATKLFRRYSVIDGINPNILHNAYFRGGGSHTGSTNFPINQRMQSSYSAAGYTVDRWKMSANSELTFTSDPADAIRLTKKTAGETVSLSQILENISRGAHTFSALVRVDLKAAGSADAGKLHLAMKDGTNNDLAFVDVEESSADPILVIVKYNGGAVSVKSVEISLNGSVPVDGYVDILACKLELGSRQTLAHRSGGAWVLNEPVPDHTVELMKCQRFFQVGSQYFHPDVNIAANYRPVLRGDPKTAPDGGSFTVGGYHWFYVSADL